MSKSKVPNDRKLDIIVELLDKLIEFKNLSSNSKMDFSEKEMFSHVAKTSEIVRDLFRLVDEFETSMGDPSYLRDEKFWG